MNQKRPTSEYFTYTNVGDNKPLANAWQKSSSFKDVDVMTVFFCDFRESFVQLLHTESSGGMKKMTVVGCVAWFSDPVIVQALQRYCENVFILVNDEDFQTWGNGNTLSLYNQLPQSKESIKNLFGHLNDVFSPLSGFYKPVRCITHGQGHIMHNKYMVFMKRDEENQWQCDSVWMGSVNFTKNSSNNMESAMYIEDRRVAEAVFHDFANLFSLSSPISRPVEYDSRKGRTVYKG